MSNVHTIEINQDKKCIRCGKGGATQGGLCLECVSKRIAVREHLKCVLTETEIKTAGAQLARSYSEITDLEDQKKSSASDFKARIDSASAQASIVARKIQNGYEFRDIDCEEVWNWDEKTVDVVRLDNGETVRSRTMTVGELQRGLFEK